MNYLRITVVTPSYNQGQFIESTILSVIEQNYPNLEYFICDGGSNDQTVDIIKKYENKIDWWCSEKDKGQTDAINKGMRRATGDIVCWINSDDVLLPGALFQVAEFYKNHPECEFANGITLEIDKKGVIQKFTYILMSKFFMRHGCYNISQQGMFWKRSLFDKIGYLDETFHAMMDAEFLIRVYEANLKVMLINKPLGAIRVYAETKTSMGWEIWTNDEETIRKRYNGAYSCNRHSFFFLLFVLDKLIRGCYFRNIIGQMRYNGLHFNMYRYR